MRHIYPKQTASVFFVATYQDEGQSQTMLDVLAIDQNGIEYETEFVASSDPYDKFLPAAEYMIKSISFDPDNVASVLNHHFFWEHLIF